MQYLPTWPAQLFARREAVAETPAAAPPIERGPAAPVKHNPTRYVREVYSIGPHRVTNDAQSGWKCECQGFAPGVECEHVKEAVRLQGVRRARR
jgi:hypothetical protein